MLRTIRNGITGEQRLVAYLIKSFIAEKKVFALQNVKKRSTEQWRLLRGRTTATLVLFVAEDHLSGEVMANLPPSLSINQPPFGVPASPSPAAAVAAQAKDRKMASAEQLVLDLCDPELRENALLDLSKKREIFQDLAPLLWNSFGTIAALLQEIVSIYPALSPPTLTPGASNRVCNALALLQCVASHSETRILFLNAHIPLYLYPFLNTTSKTRPFEYLRLTSLGVIGALVKVIASVILLIYMFCNLCFFGIFHLEFP
ncbi:hypothetical protein HPP92_000964 [Vanilla planifolia]|uniref:Uncharacterized protein n=1 Tax=Vanilla planifolia TaxID=51239 RepID=A0A835RT49_VANPL|nr:hypothetical protein HPP92_000964 [Vanilla planifolia]